MSRQVLPSFALVSCVAWLMAAACSTAEPDTSDDSAGSGGSTGEGGTDGDTGTGGDGTGGTAPTGGSSATGGSLGTPAVDEAFANLDEFPQAAKDDLIAGATATIGTHASSADGNVLELFVPGNAALGADDYNGPGAHAIEVVSTAPAQLYGRYEMSVRFASCAAGEELVNGLFTYFNDGSDTDEDGIADNSEIDIELLCGEPRYLWLTVWTDYDADDFRKSSRVVDLHTGAVRDSTKGSNEYDVSPAGSIAGLALTDFPNPTHFYRLGFEWRESSVRYFLIEDDREIELWNLDGAEYVPQRPAEFLLNLWHADTHWYSGGSADFPANDASLLVDWLKIWP